MQPREDEQRNEEHGQLEELRREMRQAAWAEWARRHAQQIAAGVVALLLAVILAGLWLERAKTERNAAALAYQRAIQQRDSAKKIEQLQQLTEQYPETPYAAMAHWLLANLDAAHAKEHLQAVISHKAATDEWRWQARLDLAARLLEEGNKAEARRLLADPVGAHYEQLADYLRALAAEDAAARRDWLQKALQAPSHDEELKARIERMLRSASNAS